MTIAHCEPTTAEQMPLWVLLIFVAMVVCVVMVIAVMVVIGFIRDWRRGQ